MVGIDKEVPAKQSWQSEAEEETLKVHGRFSNEEQNGEDSEPLEQCLVGHRAAECPEGAASVSSQAQWVDIHKVESVEADQEQRDEVQREGEAVVEGVAGGQGLAGLELVQHKVHPSLPLHILALLIPVLQLCPDVVEIVKQFL